MIRRLISGGLFVLGLTCGAFAVLRALFGVAIGNPGGHSIRIDFAGTATACLIGVLCILAAFGVAALTPRKVAQRQRD